MVKPHPISMLMILIICIVCIHLWPITQTIQRKRLLKQPHPHDQQIPKRLTDEQYIYLLVKQGNIDTAATYLSWVQYSTRSLYNIWTAYAFESQHAWPQIDRISLYEAERFLAQAQQKSQSYDLQQAIDHNLTVVRNLLADTWTPHEQQQTSSPSTEWPTWWSSSDQQGERFENIHDQLLPLSQEEYDQIKVLQEQLIIEQKDYIQYFNKHTSNTNNASIQSSREGRQR